MRVSASASGVAAIGAVAGDCVQVAGTLAGARLIAFDTSTFIYLIEMHPIFFPAVEAIFQANLSPRSTSRSYLACA